MSTTTTDHASDSEPLDLTHRCVLCPAESTPQPKGHPTGYAIAPVTGPYRPLPPATPSQPPPVDWHGVYRPAGLYAVAREIKYGLCSRHGCNIEPGSDAANALERALLKHSIGHARIPLSPAK